MTFWDKNAARFPKSCSKIVEGIAKNAIWELITDATGSQRQPAAASGSDVNPAAQSHPSSRAGGQDYVSSKQTPPKHSSRLRAVAQELDIYPPLKKSGF